MVTAGTGTGWAERHAPAVGGLDVSVAAREAVDKALAARDPEAVEPGEYPVVLLPCAVEDMLRTLGWMGMGALSVQEQRSWMTGHLGGKVAGSNVSIWDDAADPRGFVRPFDAEGVARRRVDILKGGVAVGPVYDSLTAHNEGRKSTGHASSALGNWGPVPASLVMAPGGASVDELLAAMGRGVLVTRFHYTNTIHPVETTFTGMTRDGTFWVEGGKIQRPIKNMRFAQSILGALSEVGAIGRDLQRFPHCLAPALYIKRFRFTSATDF
jgi:predicted Zn-dependent protease